MVAQAVLWVLARPAGEPTGSYVGQFLGAESILLLSIGLVLISTLPWVEEWFDGIDRAAIWHRRVAITGLVLLAPHMLLSSNPDGTALGGPLGVDRGDRPGGARAVGDPAALAVGGARARCGASCVAARDAPVVRDVRRIFGGYERWRALHRTTGLFVAAGFVHGVLDGDAVRRRAASCAGATSRSAPSALGFYVYRELLARFFLSLHDYEVDAVREIDAGLVEVAMRPIGRPVDFVPGQFAMVYLEAKDGWHRHPFTISSAPHEDVVRVTVKALGDYTSRLQELIEPGMPAVIGGPHGRFSHWKGTDRQVWIAGGVGVAPFLSWLRALDGHLPHRVDFFYTRGRRGAVRRRDPRIADRHESLHAHLIDTSVEGRLTAERVLAVADGDRQRAVGLHVRPAGDAAHLPDAAAARGRAVQAHPPRVLRLALTSAAPSLASRSGCG